MFSTMRYILLPVINITAPVLIAFAFIMLIPLAVSVAYNDGAAFGFEVGAGAAMVTGLFLQMISIHDKRELKPRDGFLLATIVWTGIPVFAAIPLYLSVPDISFTFALFESLSGTTTTCATVLTGLDSLPASINFWRCFLSWLGGMGILVLAVAILPLLGVGGAQIFKAESSGPMKETRLTPRIADTAKGLWWIYVALSVACVLAYASAGMNMYDAVVHMFTTVSLGGFSSHDASFGYWNSQDIETVAVIFMLLGGTSFSLHFIAWRRRSLLPYFSNLECWGWIFTAVAITAAVTTLLVVNGYYEDFATAFRYALFNVVSTISTTGYATTDFNLWPFAAPALMVFGACFATCGGSTGGGLKMMRAIILVKGIARELRFTLHPNAVIPLTAEGSVISNHIIFTVFIYMLLWFFVAIFGTLTLMISGLDPITALTAELACLTNLGPGLGQVGPASTFAVLNEFQLWICMFSMVIGRLEIVTVLVLFTRSFWRV